ncbi:hypothetical protein CAEBREN_02931 [Caenorhabditis brenneri]|uniref:Uncharacterized protein n=1 Tax=Caenorhabditis brenneri TaxID=135651 RepID=G0NX32_CAEBE|nr:hypothetical protein CAEBREN_02931 [Caenorhabditis brenneri]
MPFVTCTLCEQHVPKKEASAVPHNPETKRKRGDVLGEGFRRNCRKYLCPYVCRRHFGGKKRKKDSIPEHDIIPGPPHELVHHWIWNSSCNDEETQTEETIGDNLENSSESQLMLETEQTIESDDSSENMKAFFETLESPFFTARTYDQTKKKYIYPAIQEKHEELTEWVREKLIDTVQNNETWFNFRVFSSCEHGDIDEFVESCPAFLSLSSKKDVKALNAVYSVISKGDRLEDIKKVSPHFANLLSNRTTLARSATLPKISFKDEAASTEEEIEEKSESEEEAETDDPDSLWDLLEPCSDDEMDKNQESDEESVFE